MDTSTSPILTIIEPKTAKEIRDAFLARYGTEIRFNTFSCLLIFPILIMIYPQLIHSYDQMIATCIISTIMALFVIFSNSNRITKFIQTKRTFEYIASVPYFLLQTYIILQTIILSKNQDFGVFEFLVFYFIFLNAVGTFGHLSVKSTTIIANMLLLIWNFLAILKLLNIIDNSKTNNKLYFTYFLGANVVIIFSQVE